MSRLSGRISTAIHTIRCPGCGQLVIPAPPATTTETPGPSVAGGGRASFIWPPRGEVCPDCGFPLARYGDRLVWIRLFFAGVVLVTLSVLLFVMAVIGGYGGWVVWILLGLGGAGCLTLVIGLVGGVVGYRRSVRRERTP